MSWLLAITLAALAAALCLIGRQRRTIAQLGAALVVLHAGYIELQRGPWLAAARTPEEARQRVALLDDDVGGHA